MYKIYAIIFLGLFAISGISIGAKGRVGAYCCPSAAGNSNTAERE